MVCGPMWCGGGGGKVVAGKRWGAARAQRIGTYHVCNMVYGKYGFRVAGSESKAGAPRPVLSPAYPVVPASKPAEPESPTGTVAVRHPPHVSGANPNLDAPVPTDERSAGDVTLVRPRVRSVLDVSLARALWDERAVPASALWDVVAIPTNALWDVVIPLDVVCQHMVSINGMATRRMAIIMVNKAEAGI